MDALTQVLGAAYSLHVAGQDPAAIACIRGVLNAPEIHAAAEKQLADLAMVVRARSRGDRCHVHIEKVTHDLLAEALGNS